MESSFKSDPPVYFRFADEKDITLYYEWTNDSTVRQYSYNTKPISFQEHSQWFLNKIKDPHCKMYLFYNSNEQPIGQVRIEKKTEETIIGISIDKQHRGNKYGTTMLKIATQDYLKTQQENIYAYIKVENTASLNAFVNAGFKNQSIVYVNGEKSYKLLKN